MGVDVLQRAVLRKARGIRYLALMSSRSAAGQRIPAPENAIASGHRGEFRFGTDFQAGYFCGIALIVDRRNSV